SARSAAAHPLVARRSKSSRRSRTTARSTARPARAHPVGRGRTDRAGAVPCGTTLPDRDRRLGRLAPMVHGPGVRAVFRWVPSRASCTASGLRGKVRRDGRKQRILPERWDASFRCWVEAAVVKGPGEGDAYAMPVASHGHRTKRAGSAPEGRRRPEGRSEANAPEGRSEANAPEGRSEANAPEG